MRGLFDILNSTVTQVKKYSNNKIGSIDSIVDENEHTIDSAIQNIRSLERKVRFYRHF